jgi:hypothetical protein
MRDGPHHGARPDLRHHLVVEGARGGLAAKRVQDHVLGMAPTVRFGSGEEPRADESALRSEHEHRREAASVGDTSGCEDRDACHHVDHQGNQRKGRHHPYVPATLGALRDDDVGAVAGDQPGLLRRAHHVHHLHARLMRLVGEILRSAPGKRENRHALGKSHLEGRRVQLAEDVVDREWTRGELSDLPDLVAQLIGRAAEASDDAEPAGVAHGGDEVWRRVPGHACLEDGDVDPEEVADGCVKNCHSRASPNIAYPRGGVSGASTEGVARSTAL